MAGAEAMFRNMHFHHLLAIVRAAIGVELTAARALVAVQNGLDRLDGFIGEMIEFQKYRAFTAFEFPVEFPHHLTAPIIAFDKPLAAGIGGITAERARDIRARGAVVVFDQRIDLKTFQVGQFRSRVIGHGVTVTGVGGVFVGSH